MGQDEIEKNVFDAIGRGGVKMRPRWHFVVRAVLVATGSVIFFLLLVYFASTALATLYRNGVWAAPAFGLSGWLLFLRSLPLILIGFTLIFVIVIALLARHYAFVYHQPIVYLLLINAVLNFSFAASVQYMSALYLVTHGIVKIALVAGLLRNRIWAYPAAIAVFTLFGLYQIFYLFQAYSFWLLALTVLDAIVIALTWHEWKYRRKHHEFAR